MAPVASPVPTPMFICVRKFFVRPLEQCSPWAGLAHGLWIGLGLGLGWASNFGISTGSGRTWAESSNQFTKKITQLNESSMPNCHSSSMNSFSVSYIIYKR